MLNEACAVPPTFCSSLPGTRPPVTAPELSLSTLVVRFASSHYNLLMRPIVYALAVGFIAGLPLGNWLTGVWVALGMGLLTSVGVGIKALIGLSAH